MCAPPGAGDIPWLREEGFATTISVNASSTGGGANGEFRPLRETIEAAPMHRHFIDPITKQPQLQNSMRFHYPATFAWFSNESCMLDGRDMSHLTYLTKSKVFPDEERRVDQVFGSNVGLTTATDQAK
jgi:hypothetical protein